MDNLPMLSKITYVFTQEGNTDGTTEFVEELTVEVEGVFDIIKDGGYLVLRTSTGWSINDPNDLNYIFDTVIKNNNIQYDKSLINEK